MKILYIDSDPSWDAVNTRANWLKTGKHEVEVASGLNTGTYSDYDLIVVCLGERNSRTDLRGGLDQTKMARNAPGAAIIFAGIEKADQEFAKNHGANFCKLYELSQETRLTNIIEQATGTGPRR